ncbi:MAG: hypothetical protein Q4C56_02035 [Peptococcaceae bacterium]|nr:hypothetical protein [Peptococcaceae bacterium]
MCYIVATKFGEEGCIAWQPDPSLRVGDYMDHLVDMVGYDKIQLVKLDPPESFGEYAPYHYMESREAFEEALYRMA